MLSKYVFVVFFSLIIYGCKTKNSEEKKVETSTTTKQIDSIHISNEMSRLEIDEGIFVFYDSNLCRIINKQIPNEADIYLNEVLIAKLNPYLPDSFYIRYSEGMSGDPWFGVFRKDNDTVDYLGGSNGLNLTVLRNGRLFISGHTNNYFNTRKLFEVTHDTLKEIEQPFYYVGIRSRLNKDASLLSDIDNGQVIMSLPKGTMCDILLNKDEDYYLVKTEMNVVGWIKNDNDYERPTIDDIRYAGD